MLKSALFIMAFASYDTINVDEVTLIFSIEQDQEIIEQSIYGEPPQFAIWLEKKETGEIVTVSVTQKTATGKFKGRAKVPVALPAWIGAFRKETGRDDIPTPRNPMDEYDAVSRPTPKTSNFSTWIQVPYGSSWYYYVEVNVAGDFTTRFPLYNEKSGIQDILGNGQPSIIYRGHIIAKPENESIPELIGRTEQLFMSPKINSNLEGIDSARKLFRRIIVNCQ